MTIFRKPEERMNLKLIEEKDKLRRAKAHLQIVGESLQDASVELSNVKNIMGR